MIIEASAENVRVVEADRSSWIEDAGSLAGESVSLIGDCFGRFGMMDPDLRPQTTAAAFAGPMLTVWCREGDNLAIHRALDVARPGDVMVVNAFGDVTRAVFGSIIAEACVAIGLAAVVVDGSVRDVEELDGLGMPVFARGVSPAGPYKTGPGSVGETIAVGGVVCVPGQLVVGDRDGLVVLDRPKVDALPGLLEKQRAVEVKMRGRIAALAESAATPRESVMSS